MAEGTVKHVREAPITRWAMAFLTDIVVRNITANWRRKVDRITHSEKQVYAVDVS